MSWLVRFGSPATDTGESIKGGRVCELKVEKSSH
jgi:hypothetical protein